mmetsp:Transcript_45851/g.76442  ORF Transcript_45851/g.76442 Transcript_45851/m.76442 type:complete len:291 (+) Transcript_45851:1561-2433(+)
MSSSCSGMLIALRWRRWWEYCWRSCACCCAPPSAVVMRVSTSMGLRMEFTILGAVGWFRSTDCSAFTKEGSMEASVMLRAISVPSPLSVLAACAPCPLLAPLLAASSMFTSSTNDLTMPVGVEALSLRMRASSPIMRRRPSPERTHMASRKWVARSSTRVWCPPSSGRVGSSSASCSFHSSFCSRWIRSPCGCGVPGIPCVSAPGVPCSSASRRRITPAHAPYISENSVSSRSANAARMPLSCTRLAFVLFFFSSSVVAACLPVALSPVAATSSKSTSISPAPSATAQAA